MIVVKEYYNVDVLSNQMHYNCPIMIIFPRIMFFCCCCFESDLLVSNNCQTVRLSKLEQDLILALLNSCGKLHQHQTRHLSTKLLSATVACCLELELREKQILLVKKLILNNLS